MGKRRETVLQDFTKFFSDTLEITHLLKSAKDWTINITKERSYGKYEKTNTSIKLSMKPKNLQVININIVGGRGKGNEN